MYFRFLYQVLDRFKQEKHNFITYNSRYTDIFSKYHSSMDRKAEYLHVVILVFKLNKNFITNRKDAECRSTLINIFFIYYCLCPFHLLSKS